MAWLKVAELADELGVSDSLVRKWIRDDGLPSELDPDGVMIVDLDTAGEFLEELDGEDDDDGDDE